MSPEPSFWELLQFPERLEAWAQTNHPSDDLRLLVTDWVFTRLDNPYEGMRRQALHPNYWGGAVPDSESGQGRVTMCYLWIFEETRTVRCDLIATLGTPIVE